MVDLWAVSLVFIAGIPALYARSTVVSVDGSDNYGHLIHIRDIRGQDHHQSPAISSSRHATGGYYAYPYLMHWLLSFLPDERLDFLSRNLGITMDLALWLVFGSLGVVGFVTPFELLVCLGLFLTTPEFVRPDRAQSHQLSARKPGLVLTTVAMLSFAFWQTTTGPILLALAAVAGAAVFLTNKFSVQALLFFTVALAVFSSPLWAPFTLGCFVLAVLASRGMYLRVLEGHLRHLYLYVTFLQHQHEKVSNKTIVPLEFVRAIRDWVGGSGSLRTTLLEAHNNIPLQALVNNPFVVPTLAVIVLGAGTLTVPASFPVWTVAGIVTLGAISLPRLRFLGEPERYLEYVFVPSALLIAKGVTALGPAVAVLTVGTVVVGGAVVVSYAYVSGLLYDEETSDGAFDEVVSFLDSRADSTVLVQPLNRGKELSYRTDLPVVWWGGNLGCDADTLREFKTLHSEQYPYLTGDVEWLRNEYDPSWVVFDLEKYGDGRGLRPPTDAEPRLANAAYEVYGFEQLVED